MTSKLPLILLLIVIVTQSCKKSNNTDGTITGPTESGNLISNSSFESNGIASFQGWWVSDTSVVRFSNDVPQNGGNWSILIETIWGPPARVQTTVALEQGTFAYRLSTWAKKVVIGGKVSLIFKDTIRKSLEISNTGWTEYNITDTLTAVAGDSIVIELAGGFSQLLTGMTYFDNCQFERLN